ncbi:M23 family metallopeptidase [Alteriqipengyuania flavescens]|uniref:M23 family metallopeptidase n=1 Tax=Alteriqipengyuania flavescens TaxID=3053610 RepID=UPI0025B38EB4|nr:M23 family metallopeptidase [Alteriqipengyuania flavescens]WJY19649.1 M23 family metallopeptidase [Alteriqipengyuania flavescens]WJY25589.1 M23 family metallopeptidase [Alteriqipengyuania flavescens]
MRLFASVATATLLSACIPQVDTADTSGRAPAPAPTITPQVAAPPPAVAIPVPAEFTALEGEFTQGGFVRGYAPVGTVALTIDDAEVALGVDRYFFAGINRDSQSSATLVARLEDGRILRETIEVSPREWRLERVNLARPTGSASEAFMRRRAPELARINAARDVRSDIDGWRQDFVWPVKGRISGMFGSQRIYRGVPGSYHSGIDIAPGAGVPFVAPADGVVVLAAPEEFSLEGKLLIVDHGNGLNSAFLHASELAVGEGETVRQGQYLGRIGATGSATGPHLHWSVKWGAARLDPILLTGPM